MKTNVIARVIGTAIVYLAAMASNQLNADPLATSGDICAPVNVGKANRTIQNIRGSIINTSSSESIAVSCPIITITGYPTTTIIVRLGNARPFTQNFKCVLREKDIFDNDVRTITKNQAIGGELSYAISFEDVVLSELTNRYNLTCLLPPNSGLGGLWMWSE